MENRTKGGGKRTRQWCSVPDDVTKERTVWRKKNGGGIGGGGKEGELGGKRGKSALTYHLKAAFNHCQRNNVKTDKAKEGGARESFICGARIPRRHK